MAAMPGTIPIRAKKSAGSKPKERLERKALVAPINTDAQATPSKKLAIKLIDLSFSLIRRLYSTHSISYWVGCFLMLFIYCDSTCQIDIDQDHKDKCLQQCRECQQQICRKRCDEGD